MKKKILLYMAAVAGLVLAGCNKEIVLPQEGSLDMTVTASIGDLTKVAYDGASTTFQTGDQIAVWAWTGASDVLPQTFVVDGIVNTRDESGKWVPATQMLWKNVKDEHYFMAVHPVPASAIANLSAVPYAVDNTNYEASDLLLATNLEGLTASSKTVDLTFTHAMAKLQVNLKFRNQFGPDGPAPESVTAALEAKASAKVNYLTKVATPTGTVAPVAMALAATAEGYDMSFSGIQIPQAATKIVVTVGETTFSYTHPEALPLVPGKVTTLGFNVGQNVILLESVSVNDWVSDEPITGGEAELETEVNLSELTADYVAKGRVIFTGELAANVKISIADGATVTLDGVSILGVNDENCKWAGITCLGDATIILKEGSTNTVMGFHESAPGIYIAEGKTLIIKGDGSLTASTYIADPNDFDSYGHGAGIGGGQDVSCGNIEIQGGNITAIGGRWAAGIGCGSNNEVGSNCGTIKISGGTVVATSRVEMGAGIGGGYDGDCGIITISGGTVEATGAWGAPGIGSADNSTCSGIVISGGIVTATTTGGAAGIGTTHEDSVCGDITISGGTVTATGKDYCAGIGCGTDYFGDGGTCGAITITSDVTKVTATKGENAINSIGNANGGTCGTVTIGDMVTGSIPTSPYMYPIDLSKVTANVVAGNGARIFETLAGNYKVSIDDGATVILDNASISYSSNGADWAGLTLIGDGTIQLADGTTNTAIGGLDSDGYSNWPGIFVPEGKTLTINGNTGVLNAARGGDDVDDGSPAGIGAAWKYNCGSIVINGGVINATGGAKSAGIGGAMIRTCDDITINGGTVTATGNKWGTGIGLGGPVKNTTVTPISGGKITITDGTVVATGGWGGAGIGTGYVAPKSGTMTITGGDILISGGTVTATGGEGAAGIGTGEAEDGKGIINIGTITITDGVTLLTATKGEGAPNSIGKGSGTNVTCGTVTISGVVGAISDSPYVYPLPYPINLSEVTSGYVGSVIASNGMVYATASKAADAGTTALAVICYVGNDAETSTTYNHGLALALADANGGNKAAWSSVAANCLDKQYGPGDDPTVNMSGIANTDTLVSDGHDHDAASAARNFNGGTLPAGTSEWFLPSAGQWQKMITAAGSYANLVSNANLKSENDPYWSSTEKGNGSAWTYAYGKWDYFGGTSFYVRACLAF